VDEEASEEDRLPDKHALPFSEAQAERRRVFVLIGILAIAVLGIVTVSISILSTTAMNEERERLLETARSQARLIEAVARYDAAQFGGGTEATEATISQIVDAHREYEAVGETGEFTLARLEDGQIVFLLSHHHLGLSTPEAVPFDAELAEPMRRALRGESGTVIGPDYRGATVLAAYEPVAELGLGIVAKIDLAELRRPFVGAALYSVGPAIVIVLLGAWVFTRVTRPLVWRIGEGEQRYRDLVETMSDGLAMQDSSRKLVYVNDRFCEVVGRTRDEVIGHRTDEYMTPQGRAEFDRRMTERERGSTQSYHVTYVRSDGSDVDVLLSPRAIHDARGRFTGSFAIVSDITGLKRTEALLRREKEQAQRYLDLAGVMFVLLDREGRIRLVNRRGVEILGYDGPDELVGKDWFDTCIPDTLRSEIRAVFADLLRGEVELNEYYENPVITREGARRVVAWHSALIENDDGEVEAVLSSGEDVTERRSADERFRLAAEVASDLIYEWDIDSDALRWYGDIDGALGYAPGTIESTIEAWGRLIHPEDAERLATAVERHRVATEPIHEEYRIRDADGGWRHWLDRGAPVFDEEGAVVRWIGACVDITALRHHEAALARRADQLEAVNEVGRSLTSILDLDPLLEAVARTIHERFGYYYVDIFLIDDEEAFAVFRAGSDPEVAAGWRRRELKFAIGREGMIGEVAKTGVPLLSNDVSQTPQFLPNELVPETQSELVVPIVYEGRVIGVLDVQGDRLDAFQPEDVSVLEALGGGIAVAIVNARLYEAAQREIAEREQAERALKRSEEEYRSLFNNAVLGIYKTTPDGRILAANPALVRILGFRALEELKERDLEVRAKERRYARDAFKEHMERDGAVSGLISEWTRRDGRIITIRENARAIQDAGGTILYYEGTVEDITEQREAERAREALEAQLIHNQKLESIGTLASGVAHEINNPLTGMINYAQLIEGRVVDEALTRYAEGIIREGQRVATIVRNLLSFSRHEKEARSLAEIRDIVEVVLSLIGSALRKDRIRLEVDVPEDLPRLRCRSQQIEQVLLNLLTNARDALNQRYPDDHEDKLLRVVARTHDVEGRPGLRVTVEDHGVGIEEELRDRIFDPFFTSKPRDEGTGLGLSISHGIVRDHGGELTIECEPGGPTRFHMDLPTKEKDAPVAVVEESS